MLSRAWWGGKRRFLLEPRLLSGWCEHTWHGASSLCLGHAEGGRAGLLGRSPGSSLCHGGIIVQARLKSKTGSW